MKAKLRGQHLQRLIGDYGLAAVILDYFVLPHIREFPRHTPSGERQTTASKRTLQTLIRHHMRLSKAMSLAESKYEAEELGATKAAPTAEEVKAVFEQKFPAAPEGSELPAVDSLPKMNWRTGKLVDVDGTDCEEDASFFLESDTLEAVLAGLSKPATAGVSTTTNLFLRRTFKDGLSPAAENVLLPFCRMFLAGAFSRVAVALLQAGRLALIPKGEKGEKAFRPLGIGDAMTRLVGKCIMKQEGRTIGLRLAKLQVAVSVSDGTTVMAEIAQMMFDLGRSMLALDCANAYNTVNRDAVLRGLKEHAPQLVRWFLTCYSGDTRVYHITHGFVGTCRTGVKQGDPLPTLFFALALQEALEKIDADVKHAHGGQPRDQDDGVDDHEDDDTRGWLCGR